MGTTRLSSMALSSLNVHESNTDALVENLISRYRDSCWITCFLIWNDIDVLYMYHVARSFISSLRLVYLTTPSSIQVPEERCNESGISVRKGLSFSQEGLAVMTTSKMTKTKLLYQLRLGEIASSRSTGVYPALLVTIRVCLGIEWRLVCTILGNRRTDIAEMKPSQWDGRGFGGGSIRYGLSMGTQESLTDRMEGFAKA